MSKTIEKIENSEKMSKKNSYDSSNFTGEVDTLSNTNNNLSRSSSSSSEDYKGLKPDIISSFEKMKIDPDSIRKLSCPVYKVKDEYELNFSRDSEGIRKVYYNSLINKGIWNNNQKKYNTLFIFDWDDTLFCTSMLSPYGYFDDNMRIDEVQMNAIAQLEELVYKLLSKTISKGDTYIITNSEEGWVEYSSERFFPRIFKDLIPKIKIISARELYEKQFPCNSKMWKVMAFNNLIHKYYLNLPTNILCIGDSFNEIEAGKNLATKFPNSFIKTIKFREFPKIEELMKQLSLVIGKFDFICNTCKNWSIRVEKKDS